MFNITFKLHITQLVIRYMTVVSSCLSELREGRYLSSNELVDFLLIKKNLFISSTYDTTF